ncbi:VapC toxin family PIN domain ribonuclease [Halobacteriales archaeon QS_9_67_17]|nr:MAG: VapC toxin family PIN domain ribonuclease [Halobacteriales archaeon QS_9_67_17]
MAVAFLDSNVLIGAANSRDQHHEAALEILRTVDSGELPSVRLTNYVVSEAVGYIHTRQSHATAIELYDRLKTGSAFEFVLSPKSTFFSAEERFRTHEQLSFVDATLVADMARDGVEYIYSFDDDFDGIDGISRLAVPENPFA